MLAAGVEKDAGRYCVVDVNLFDVYVNVFMDMFIVFLCCVLFDVLILYVSCFGMQWRCSMDRLDSSQCIELFFRVLEP